LQLCIPILLLGWLILAVAVFWTSIRVVDYEEEGIELTGVCREFIVAYQEHCQQNRTVWVSPAVLERWDERDRHGRLRRRSSRSRKRDSDDY
jgi:hypothetical protein